MYQTTYAEVMDELRQGGVFERDRYLVGRRSFGFRLADRFAHDRHVRVPVTDQRLIKRLASFAAEHHQKQVATWLPVHHALADQQRRLRIHGDQAREWLSLNQEANRFDVQGVLVGNIESGQFHFSVGTYGRVFNSISNLKRGLRYFIHVGGKPLWHVDLSCCQPALIAKMIVDRKPLVRRQTEQEGETTRVSNYDSSGGLPDHYDSSPENRVGADVARYLELVRDGSLYDALLREAQSQVENIDRDELKRQFMCDVIAKRGDYPRRVVEQVFVESFPTVSGFIREVNGSGREHKNLIQQLHREEARFVIGRVVTDLVSRFPGMFILTLHDAIYVAEENLTRVEQAFDRAFEQTGFRMSWKVKPPEMIEPARRTPEPFGPAAEIRRFVSAV
ncbi:MAG: hypothetical protein NT013_04975 [Planctomycetia bacterium]|nr:hypothetical protein [Planctomycetia bacterium]